MNRQMIAVALLIAMSGGAHAQQNEFKWTQTTNMPKGQNMPRDRADILGLELGDTYEEAKAKLQKLAAEGIQAKQQGGSAAERMAAKMDGQRNGPPPMREEKRIYNLRAPGGGTSIAASYVAKIEIQRDMPTANGKTDENIAVYFTAPSSGHQVVGVTRNILYLNDADQPLISETLAQLKKKMQFEPQAIGTGNKTYRFQFNDGKPYAPAKPTLNSCLLGYGVENPSGLKQVNEPGDCDAVLDVSPYAGMSSNHAKRISFALSDNDRTKANVTADFAFLSDYVDKLQQNTRGAPPKL